jgi:hypothetical protein
LTATNWASAQRMLADGQADVIDMIFRTPPRDALYDFSPPYADLPVAIYHHATVGGISGPATLQASDRRPGWRRLHRPARENASRRWSASRTTRP